MSVPLLGIALRQNRHPAGNCAAGHLHQRLHGVERTAGGDHVIHQQDALAPDQVRIVPAQVQLLRPRRW